MMCDTSLIKAGEWPESVPRTWSHSAPATPETVLTCANAESTKMLGGVRPVEATYRQFGPVVDLAYTRRRATW